MYKNLKLGVNNRSKNKNKNLSDLYPMVMKTVHRRWFSHRKLQQLKFLVSKRKNEFTTNVIKVCLMNMI